MARIEKMKKDRTFGRLLLVFVVLATSIVATSYVYYHRFERHFRAQVENQMSAVAELKADELQDWGRDRLANAEVFHDNPAFAEQVRRFLEEPNASDAQRMLQAWLGKLQLYSSFNRVSLIDTQGVRRLSFPDTSESVPSCVLDELPRVLLEGKTFFKDFHREAPDSPVHISIMVPVFDERDGKRPLGVLVLRIDPKAYLYPFLSRWPTPSRTAETLLCRREGDSVVFLNDLKYQDDAALKLRISMARSDVLAVQGALGKEGVVEGVDYRGVPVIGCVRAVPGSPWFLVARMDVEEVYEPLRARLWQLIILVGILIFGAGSFIGLIWRQHRILFYRERYESAEALRKVSSRMETILSAVPDIIMEVDRNKTYVWANEAGKEFFGEGVIGKEAAFFFEGEQDTYRDLQPLFSGSNQLIYLESWQRRKDGEKRLLAWWCRALKDESGRVTGALSSGRDITEQNQAETKVSEQLDELRRWHKAMLGREGRVLEVKKEVNELLTRLGEPPRYPIGSGEVKQ